jgi:hypothetical protein
MLLSRQQNAGQNHGIKDGKVHISGNDNKNSKLHSRGK